MDSYSPAGEPLSIFTAACENFRASLPDAQRRHFVEYKDAKSMLESIRRQAEQHPSQKTVLAKCCKAIAEISTKLGPYFEVISIFVSSHPEFAGLVWGSLRLVFLLGTNHAQYLERVCGLLSIMSDKLPAYEEFLSFWNPRRVGHSPPTRLFKAMAYVYADLVQFCFEVCQILHRKSSASRLFLRGSFLSSLPSTLVNPFPLRFDTLVKRWEHHSQLVELEIAVLTGVDQMQATERIELILKKFLEVGMFDDRNTQDYWRDEAATKDRLRCWVNAPPWMGIYESSQAQQEATSTDWFLDYGVVDGWISEITKQSQQGNPAVAQILSIQGKPGFGKTTLCSTLIERIHGLEASPVSSSHRRQCRSALAFFFFDKQRPDSSSTDALWRAVVAQLLHTMVVFDSDVIDALLLFREGRDRLAGQAVASHSEIFSVLVLLIHRLDRFTLIVDGIDECQDQDRFWNDLQSVTGGPIAVFTALFSRPTVEIPPGLLPNATIVPLDSGLNLTGIQTYLRPRIVGLIERGLIPVLNDLEGTIREIAMRANGMFLWATLFFEYIRSPHLSIRDRKNAIDSHYRLEGLDKLYMAILSTLVRLPGDVQACTLRTFEMVLYSARPLHVSELAHSIATPIHRSLESDDLIPRFQQNVGPLSGALLELDADDFVRFVHLSVIEYLTDGNLQNQGSQFSAFFVDKYSSHLSLASCCLSYLYHTVKAEPLSGSSRCPPDSHVLIKRYPLLDYATQYWSHHLLECIASLMSGNQTDMPPAEARTKRLIELASDFLSNGRSILVWIEASWMFKREPQIRDGPTDLFFRQVPVRPPDPRQVTIYPRESLDKARTTLLELSRDLSELNASWAHVFSEEPNEIWEPSVSAFNRSRFWDRVSGVYIAARFAENPEPGYRSACLKTRLSPGGRRLGLVRLRVPAGDQSRATVHFEMWSTEPNQKLDDIDLNVPRRCLKPFLADLDAEFQCPVAITADLGRVVVPGCAMVIPLAQDREQGQWVPEAALDEATQFIDFTGNGQRNGPFPFAIEDFELGYDIQVSDSGRYLMTVHRSNGIVDINEELGLHLRLVTVYEDVKIKTTEPPTRGTRPSYKHISSMAFKPNYLEHHDKDGNWCALLHPRYPIVAIRYQRYVICPSGRISRKGRDATDGLNCLSSALWRFDGASADRAFRFVNQRPDKLAFDHDGEYFCGVRVADLMPATPKALNGAPLPQFEQLPSSTLGTTRTPHRDHSDSLGNIQIPYLASAPTIQRLGEKTSYVDRSGYRCISQLDSSNNEGVVLQTLREDGRLKVEMLARLPQHIDRDFTASLLRVGTGTSAKPGSPADNSTVLFLDRENRPFQAHNLQPEPDGGGIPGAAGEAAAEVQLPLILHRKRETIPTVVGRGVYDVERGIGVLSGPRKRPVGWEEEDDNDDMMERYPKKRL